MPDSSLLVQEQGERTRPKIFLLGFNKCGTRSFDTVFHLSGIRAAHWRVKLAGGRRIFVAKHLQQNVERGIDPLAGLEGYDAFSDLTYVSPFEVIEANRYFRELHNAHPDAYFILNTRDVKGWLLSRVKHRLRARASSFWARSASATGLSRLDVLNWWEAEFRRHHAEVRAYFAGNPRFMEFDIERDDFSSITTFLQADYTVDLSEWGNRGGRNQAKQDKKRSWGGLDTVKTRRSPRAGDIFNMASLSYFYNEVLRRN